MDWNCDGNHDWKDDAFYNNVVSEKCEINGGSNGLIVVGRVPPLTLVLLGLLFYALFVF